MVEGGRGCQRVRGGGREGASPCRHHHHHHHHHPPTKKHYVRSTELYLYQCGWHGLRWFARFGMVSGLVCLSGLGWYFGIAASPSLRPLFQKSFPPSFPRLPRFPLHTHLAHAVHRRPFIVLLYHVSLVVVFTVLLESARFVLPSYSLLAQVLE